MRFFSKNLFVIFLGGLSNGLPGVLTWQTLNLWLDQLGYSKSIIGLMFFANIPYSLKFLLSPIVEHIPLPLLEESLGRRRSWAVFTQTGMLCCLCAIGHTTGAYSLYVTAFLSFLTSFLSALNQIATVAHRIESVHEPIIAHGVAVGITGYRIGKLLGRAGALCLMSLLPWYLIYYSLASVLLLSIFYYATTPDQTKNQTTVRDHAQLFEKLENQYPYFCQNRYKKHIFATLIFPFLSFKKSHQDWVYILLMIFSINIGDDLILGMIDLFYFDIGFSRIEVAQITQIFGLICCLFGGFLAAELTRRFSLLKLMQGTLFLHAISHLCLVYLSYYGPVRNVLFLTITLEHLTVGMKAALLATYISYLCKEAPFTGTQYAFFSSIKACSLTLVSCLSGIYKDHVTWETFFITSFLLAFPALILLSIINSSKSHVFSEHIESANVRDDKEDEKSSSVVLF